MKAHLAKLSLALLSTVFLFGCQDMGSEPVGPGPEFHHSDGHTKGGGGGEEDDRPTYDISATGDISFDMTVTRPLRQPENLAVDDLLLDLSFFDGKLSCNFGMMKPADMRIGFADVDEPLSLFFFFQHEGANQHIEFLLARPNIWPPTGPSTIQVVHVGGQQWVVGSGGKNRRDACTGDAAPVLGITISITPL